jgi:osmotically-inducible protein OsmY
MVLAAGWILAGTSCGAPMTTVREQSYDPGPVMADEKIELALLGRLERDEFVNAHGVDLEVDNGVVMLDGSVDTLAEKRRVFEIIESTRGVISLVDHLRVEPAGRSDEEIKKDVEKALLADPVTEDYEVTVGVKQARVTLGGTVNSFEEKRLAERVAGDIRGVEIVVNRLTVDYDTPRPDQEIREEVERRLEMDPYLDRGLIWIGVDDGRVTLNGKVGSLAQKGRAYYDAWVFGVDEVDDTGVKVVRALGNPMIRKEPPFVRPAEEIKRAVELALTYDPHCDVAKVDVRVKPAGQVILSGSVDNLEAVYAAGEAAYNTLGVWVVDNHLKVVPERMIEDLALAANLKEALERDPVLAGRNLHALVRNGRVSLYGSVDYDYLRQRAEALASRIFGVVAVDNYIAGEGISEIEADREILGAVAEEIYVDPFLDFDEIDLSVEDGTVTIRGAVDSRHELIEAVECAFRGGAREVRSRLTVEGSPDPYLGYLYLAKGRIDRL